MTRPRTLTGEIVVRDIHPHRANCTACAHVRDGTWSTPWYLESVVWRDSIGRKSRRGLGKDRWLRFLCNTITSAPCKAEILVRVEPIEVALPIRRVSARHARRVKGRGKR